jgi:hypothetical protein
MVGFSGIVIAILTLLATVPQAYALTALVNNSALFDADSSQNADVAEVLDAVGPLGVTVLVGVLQFVVATTIISALLIVAVDSAVRGQIQTPAQLWKRSRPRLLAVLGLALTVTLAFPLVILTAMVPGLLLLMVPSATVVAVILMFFGLLAGVLVAIALYAGFWAVAAPALLLENLGVFASLRRSYGLVRGNFWRVVGIGVLTAVIAYIIRQVFSIPFAVIGLGVTSFNQNSQELSGLVTQVLIADIGTVLAGAVLFPFTAGVTALLYLDLRMRREGLDVDLMRT